MKAAVLCAVLLVLLAGGARASCDDHNSSSKFDMDACLADSEGCAGVAYECNLEEGETAGTTCVSADTEVDGQTCSDYVDSEVDEEISGCRYCYYCNDGDGDEQSQCVGSTDGEASGTDYLILVVGIIAGAVGLGGIGCAAVFVCCGSNTAQRKSVPSSGGGGDEEAAEMSAGVGDDDGDDSD